VFGFTFDLGPTGVWGGLALGLTVAALLLSLRMQRAMRRVRDGGPILAA
jgi:Na+-driven multidrug efflux pump